MTTEEVLKLIDTDDKQWDAYEDFLYDKEGTKRIIGGLEFEMVHRENGFEGGGEDVERVFKIGDEYFAQYGRYESYEGTDWFKGELTKVKPEQVMITVYKSV